MYNTPRIIMEDNKINITNFTSIEHFSQDKIILKINEKYISIFGTNLIISKLIIDEVLIGGNIEKIEFR